MAYIPWGHKKAGHELAAKQHVKKARMERLHHILLTNTAWWGRLKGQTKCRRKYRVISSYLPFIGFNTMFSKSVFVSNNAFKYCTTNGLSAKEC